MGASAGIRGKRGRAVGADDPFLAPALQRLREVFGAMPIWRNVVARVELAKPSVQGFTVLRMLGFVT